MGLTLSHKPLNLADTLAVFTACRGRYAQARMQTRDGHRYGAGDATATRPRQGHPMIGMAMQVGSHEGCYHSRWRWRHTFCTYAHIALKKMFMHGQTCADKHAEIPPRGAPVTSTFLGARLHAERCTAVCLTAPEHQTKAGGGFLL